jgi:uncharacterized protein (TIGR02147 family)
VHNLESAGKLFHFRLISDEFIRRKQKNPRYSLRSYARQIGVHPSTLSLVLSRKRALGTTDALIVSEKLKLADADKKEFFASLLREKKKAARITSPSLFGKTPTLTEADAFDVIAEWEHYALLNLMRTDNFQSNFTWIAKRLGISDERAKNVFTRLQATGLADVDGEGKMFATKSYVSTTDQIFSKALLAAHKNSLEGAIDAIENGEKESRDLTSSVFCVDPAQISKIRKEIRNFYKRIDKYIAQKPRTEVFEIMIAMFPRTRKL